MRLGGVGIVTACAAIIALAGLALIMLGLHRVLAAAVGPALASIILGFVCLGISGALLWISRAKLHP